MDKQTEKENSKPVGIIVAAVAVVILIVVLVLVLANRSDETGQTVEQPATESASQQSPDPVMSEESAEPEPTSAPDPVQAFLPAGWDSLDRRARLDFWNELDLQQQADFWQQLSSKQKTFLNPLDCPVDDNNIVRLSAETGECLEVVATDSEDQPIDLPPSIPTDAQTVGLGEAFMYSADSEVTVTGLSCINLEFLVLPHGLDKTVGQVLSEKAADYARYKADSYSLFQEYSEQNLNVAYLEYYAYLSSFEEYLAEAGMAVDGELAGQLFEYLVCDISVKLKNIGADSTFSDGCGLRFDKPVSLVAQAMVYGEQYRNRLYEGIACSQAEVPFPTGATDGDTVSFIVSSADQIAEILVEGSDRAFRVVLDRD